MIDPKAVTTQVAVRGPSGEWTQIGSGAARGITPENLTLSSDQSGPSNCAFTLRRDPAQSWADLQPGNQMEVTVNGVIVWGGRIRATPATGIRESGVIQVQAEGWRAHLDDDQIDMGWVHFGAGRWKNHRDFAEHRTDLFKVLGSVDAGNGALRFGWPVAALAAGDSVGVTFDPGPNRKISSVAFDWATSAITNTFWYFRVKDTDSNPHAATYTEGAASGNSIIAFWGVGPGTSTITFSPARRYLTIFLYINPGFTPTGEPWARMSNVRVFTNDAYRSGNDSILKASNVVTDVLASGALPLLDPSTDLIEATSFSIPEFWPDGYRTPMEIIAAVNAFHDYLFGVDARRRMFFRSRPTAARYVTGAWSGEAFADASLGDLSHLANKAIVEYTGPDGQPASTIRTSTSSILTGQGITKAKRLQCNAVLTAAAANQIGDVWLAKYTNAAPLSGSITVRPGDVKDILNGNPVHPSFLLTQTGERISLSDRNDPDRGGLWRDGTITSVTYNASTEEAQIQLDNDTSSLEAFLSRLAVIQGAG